MPSITNALKQPMVFYDGGCPMCSREIGHYRRLDRAEAIRWLDITSETQLLDDYDLSVHQAMQRFHVLDRDGNWQTGAHGFIEVWSALPYYRHLAFIARKLHLGGPMDVIYRQWARWRWQRRCTNERCGLSHD